MNNFNSPYNQKISLLDRFKNFYKRNGIVGRLIIINVSVYVLMSIIEASLLLFNIKLPYSLLAVPSDFTMLINRPWTIFTYMFMHDGLFHIFFNMLWLYIMGRLFIQYISKDFLVYLYVLGGLFGAAAFIGAYNVFPYFSDEIGVAVGASAAVTAIIVAICFYMPNFQLNFMFIGRVKLLYIAAAFILLDLTRITSDNAGGYISHLGGALFGYIFISQYKRGNNILKIFTFLVDKLGRLFKRKPKIRVEYTRQKKEWNYNANKKQKSADVDDILDKIKKKGYDSLTKEEKQQLFKN